MRSPTFQTRIGDQVRSISVIPGVSSFITAQVETPVTALNTANLLIIDTLNDQGFSIGSGSLGTISERKDSLYEFSTSRSFQQQIGGGALYKLSEKLFSPRSLGGISTLTYINPSTTTPATATISFDSGGEFVVRSKKEGGSANGVITDSVLTRGYSAFVSQGLIDTDSFVVSFRQGNYKGLDTAISTDSASEIFLPESESGYDVIARSPELSSVDDLVLWANTDINFQNNFELVSSVSGVIATADISTTDILFAGGTALQSTAALDAALDAISDHKKYDAVLLLNSGADAANATNVSIFNFFTTEATQVKTSIVIGGYSLPSQLSGTSSTQTVAQSYNSDSVSVTHGYTIDVNSRGIQKRYNALYTAALYIGTRLGLPSQVPATNKEVSVLGSWNPTQKQQELCITSGILTLKNDNGQSVWLLDINTIQNNSLLLNTDASSRSNQVIAISRELQKTTDVDLQNTFLKNPLGANSFTASPSAVASRIQEILENFEVTTNTDNLILSFKDIVVSKEQDRLLYSFCVTLNSEVNYIIGNMVLKIQ